MIAFLKRLFSRPTIEDMLKEFGGEEAPYASLSKHKPGDAKAADGERIVFSGRPVARTFSCYRKTAHQSLYGKKAEDLGVLITQKGDEYFWKSRGSFPLQYTQNGRFHYFTSARGAFIKIVEKDGRFHYIEGFTYSMVSFLLWGESDALNLQPANHAPEPMSGLAPGHGSP